MTILRISGCSGGKVLSRLFSLRRGPVFGPPLSLHLAPGLAPGPPSHARPIEKRQLRVESYAPIELIIPFYFWKNRIPLLPPMPSGKSPRMDSTSLNCPAMITEKSLIDNRPIVALEGTSPLNIGEAINGCHPARIF